MKRFFAGVLWAACVTTAGLRATPAISNVSTDQAMYAPGAAVSVVVTATNSSGTAASGVLNVTIRHLGNVVASLPAQATASIATGTTSTNTFTWTVPGTNYQGYMVEVTITNGGLVTGTASSAIDASSDWSKFPRYGYVAWYTDGIDANGVVAQLNNYHLNGLQFYDWQWKHHVPYNPASSWTDIGGRTNSAAVITGLIAAAHARNMVAMNYNVYGGAFADYLTDGSGVNLTMGIFSSPSASLETQMSLPLPQPPFVTPAIYTMNNRDAGWQNYIYGQEALVFANYAFDGWHVDAFAQHAVYDYAGNAFNLDDYNPEFLNNAQAYLGKRVTFNTVDAVGENQVAQYANVDFVYSELWSGNANYADFNTRVNNVRSLGPKAIVMPAYMNSASTNATFDSASVRLTDAAMFACGGAHLELGDSNQMLQIAYFPQETMQMSASLMGAMRSYYDFLTGYENLLRGDTVSGALGCTLNGVTTSTDGEAGSVWVISKQTLGAQIVHLVNFLKNTSTAWADPNGTYSSPPTKTNIGAKMYYRGEIDGGRLWYATPDNNAAQAVQLSYTTGSDGGGNYVSFTIPRLQYWDMVWLELNGTTSASSQILGQNYDSMAGIKLETTADSGGGTQDVGSVANTTGGSYLAYNNVNFGGTSPGGEDRVATQNPGGSVEFHLDSPTGTLIATVPVPNTGGWQTWLTASAPVTGASGTHALYVVFKGVSSNLNWFQFEVLPSPWVSQDVGATGLLGSAAYASGTFTVNGSGWDIWLGTDAFQYVYQPVSGDCAIMARVVSQTVTDPWAKAGVMVRSSTATDAGNALLAQTGTNGLLYTWRDPDGGISNIPDFAQVPGINVPTWVRLVLSSGTATSYESADGATWTEVGSTTLTSTLTLIGLAVCAHNSGLVSTAVFDNVLVSPLTAPGGPTAAAGDGQVTVSWAAAPGAASYDVKRSATAGGPYTSVATTTGTSVTDAAVTDGYAYYYVVAGSNAAGDGPSSTQVTALPTNPTVTWQQANFGANWNNPAIAGDLANPSGDGWCNLLKRALNGNPWAAQGKSLVQYGGVNGRLTLTFSRNTANTDLTITVQGANGPGGPWTALATSTGGGAFVVNATGATVLETGSAPTPTDAVSDVYLMTDPSHPMRFMRVQVAH